VKPLLQIFVFVSLDTNSILRFVHGTLSQNNSGRGIAYYRLLASATAFSNVVFGILYVGVLPYSHELFWDRLTIFLFAITVFLIGLRKNVEVTNYTYLVGILFYLNTTHIVWTVANNHFNGIYILSLLITSQVYAYSYRNISEAFWYLLYMCVISLTALFVFEPIALQTHGVYATIIIMISVLQYLASRVKCKFMEAMKMNQDLLKSLISKSEDAVFLTDMNGNILDTNYRVQELFGYDRSEIIDRDFKVLRKYALTSDEIENGLSELETKKFWTSVSVLVRNNGDEVPVRISITLIKNAAKKYLVYRVMDITAAKLNEAKIIEAKDKAEEAVRAKGQFLAVMSHEIRTPLNGVIATASLMQQTSLDAEQEEYALTIKKSGQSLLMLINDILEFSKMENGKMVLDPHDFKVDDAIFDVADLLRPHADAKGIDLEVSVGNSVPAYMNLDGHRLKQILFNLAGNAIKFTEHGKVEVSCECIKTIHKEVQLQFKVKDSGIGIPKEKMHLLFQSFTQMDSSTSRKYGGTGLGLAISWQLVEMMGGHFEVTSEVGVGTTFSFCINGTVAENVEINSSISPKEMNPNLDLSSLKILVGEDNEINRQVLKFILESMRIKADFAEDGLQVLNACREKDYDIIFMDMQMPEMDGLDATLYIRSNFQHQPHIIAITANSFEEDKKRCSDVGMNDFLAKPYEPADLKSILAKWYLNSGKDVHTAA
jgi:PAS domain S-box-containing protein